MKILSLFDGCAMTYQALKNLGANVEKYYSSEIDKYAIKIAKKNHPDIIPTLSRHYPDIIPTL